MLALRISPTSPLFIGTLIGFVAAWCVVMYLVYPIARRWGWDAWRSARAMHLPIRLRDVVAARRRGLDPDRVVAAYGRMIHRGSAVPLPELTARLDALGAQGWTVTQMIEAAEAIDPTGGVHR